jgi:hypothetical protein
MNDATVRPNDALVVTDHNPPARGIRRTRDVDDGRMIQYLLSSMSTTTPDHSIVSPGGEEGRSTFDTKIAIVLRDDLAVWQKLNVTAFLTSGIVGATAGLVGELYEDSAGTTYHPLVVQPMIVLSADARTIKTIYQRAMERRVRMSLFIEDMFTTGHDGANRAAVKRYMPADMNVVGLAFRDDKKLVDKITKGARLHT